jgi:hypothetical protein
MVVSLHNCEFSCRCLNFDCAGMECAEHCRLFSLSSCFGVPCKFLVRVPTDTCLTHMLLMQMH